MARTPSKPTAEAPAAAAVAPAPPKSRKLLVIAILVFVVLAAAGGGAVWFVLSQKANASSASEEKRPPKNPVFVELEVFTVNLRDREAERFLQTKIVLEMRDNPAAEALKARVPAVRNEMLLLLSSKSPQDVLTREGKEKLAGELIASANVALAGTPAEGAVEKLLFAHLIVQ